MPTSAMLLGLMSGLWTASPTRRTRNTSHGLTVEHVLDIVKKEHPEVESRFITTPEPEFTCDKYDIDFERVEEVTGMRKGGFPCTGRGMLYDCCIIRA